MNEKDLLKLVAAIPAIRAELQAKIISVETASAITKGIIELNYHIDKMGNNKDEHYYALVECCYTYYRMFDAFL